MCNTSNANDSAWACETYTLVLKQDVGTGVCQNRGDLKLSELARPVVLSISARPAETRGRLVHLHKRPDHCHDDIYVRT